MGYGYLALYKRIHHDFSRVVDACEIWSVFLPMSPTSEQTIIRDVWWNVMIRESSASEVTSLALSRTLAHFVSICSWFTIMAVMAVLSNQQYSVPFRSLSLSDPAGHHLRNDAMAVLSSKQHDVPDITSQVLCCAWVMGTLPYINVYIMISAGL